MLIPRSSTLPHTCPVDTLILQILAASSLFLDPRLPHSTFSSPFSTYHILLPTPYLLSLLLLLIPDSLPPPLLSDSIIISLLIFPDCSVLTYNPPPYSIFFATLPFPYLSHYFSSASTIAIYFCHRQIILFRTGTPFS